jgi:hypothetical protein
MYWRRNISHLNVTAVPNNASPADDAVLADVDVRVHQSSVDDAALACQNTLLIRGVWIPTIKKNIYIVTGKLTS